MRHSRALAQSSARVQLSIVVPLFNEVGTLEELHLRLTGVLQLLALHAEVIYVDDGSTDGTDEVLAAISERDAHVRLITLARNYGQTAALAAGFDAAAGEVIVAMDGDLQHAPEEIPRLLEKLGEGYDIVSGWRERRVDGLWTRRLPSRIANWLMARLSGVTLHDFGTTFKAYRREIIKELQLYGQMHRFIPALASWSGATIAEIPIKNLARGSGKSNYGLSRTITVLLDLICIKFLLDYSTRPLQFFGRWGLLSAGAGAISAVFLLVSKFVLNVDVMQEHGPLFLTTVLLIICGIQLISVGLIGETLSRTYYESQKKRIYSVAETKRSKAAVSRLRG